MIVAGLGRARHAPQTDYTYTDLWSAKTTWGGDSLPRAGDSIVVSPGHFIVLDFMDNALSLWRLGHGQWQTLQALLCVRHLNMSFSPVQASAWLLL